MSNVLSLKLNKGDETPFIIENTEFTIQDKSIIFNYENTEYSLNYLDKIFTRENDEFYFELDFINKKCQYKLISADVTLDIEVEKCNFIKKNNSIFLNYVIESDTNEINIEINIMKGEII
ncbi:MAG: hypothetical protein ACI31M_02745 [Bacilli bacterium]